MLKIFFKNNNWRIRCHFTYLISKFPNLQDVPINMGTRRRRLERCFWFLIFNALQRKCENEAVRLTSFSCVFKIDLLNKLKFVQILQCLIQLWRFKNGIPHFEHLKLKRFRCFNWNVATIVLMKQFRMDRIRYKSRHLISHVNWDTLYYKNLICLFRDCEAGILEVYLIHDTISGSSLIMIKYQVLV